MSPAHRGPQRRWLVLVVVVLVIVGLAVAGRSPGTSSPGSPPDEPAALIGAPDAESSAWYCTGQTTAAGKLAPGSVILTNTASLPVTGTIHAVTDTGAKVNTLVAVPARGQLVADIPAPASGTWVSALVTLSAGGVAVTQAVHGPSGWAEAPCQSSTSQDWYFPSGVTTGSNALFIALYNPTSTPDVVDLSFVTAQGIVHPINFQAIVLQPDETQVESVSPFVQDQANVATTVSTRTGRLVATELQLLSGGGSGVAIVPGAPHPEDEWVLPQNGEVVGGSSAIEVFNPTPATQQVTVRARLGSAPLSPFTHQVLPDSTWILLTSAETRIPKGDPYSAVIRATGGPGVVVGRIVAAPLAAPAPQQGLTTAIDTLTARAGSRRWLVPPPASPLLSGAAPAHLALTNVSGRGERYVIRAMQPSGSRIIASGELKPASTFALSDPLLARIGLDPLIVSAGAALAVSEDIGPTGSYGVVTMPGIPLALAAGS